MSVLNTIINELIQLLIPIVVSAIAAYVARKLVPAAISFINTRLDESQRAFIKATLEMAAHSTEAERIRVALSQGTFDALAYAIRVADDELNRYGIDLDQAAIKAGLLAELHKLRIFTDITDSGAGLSAALGTIAAPTLPTAAPMVVTNSIQSVELGEGDTTSRGILPIPTDAPPQLVISQRKALMWL